MSLEVKLAKYLEKLNYSPNCNREDFYKWADYVELKCLANKDGIYSVSNFIDDVRPRAEDLGEGDFEEIEEERENKITKAQKFDKWEIFSKEIFNLLEVRAKTFEEFYPYELSNNNLSIKLSNSIGIKERLYFFLLFSANLQFTGDFTNSLTSSFEYMSREVLKNFLPKSAIIKVFASSNIEEKKSWVINESRFWDKLKFLEDFLKSRILIEEEGVSKYNRGDGGLDLVAIVPVGDEQSHFPIIFAQCSCSGEDWIKKQAEIKRDIWQQRLQLNTIPQYFMFIPQNYRTCNGNWFRSDNLRDTVLIDRQRILKNFKKINKFKKYSSYKIVKSIIESKESTF